MQHLCFYDDFRRRNNYISIHLNSYYDLRGNNIYPKRVFYQFNSFNPWNEYTLYTNEPFAKLLQIFLIKKYFSKLSYFMSL